VGLYHLTLNPKGLSTAHELKCSVQEFGVCEPQCESRGGIHNVENYPSTKRPSSAEANECEVYCHGLIGFQIFQYHCSTAMSVSLERRSRAIADIGYNGP